MSKILSFSEMANAQEAVLLHLKRKEEQLRSIGADGSLTLLDRWQQMLEILLGAQMGCAAVYGFKADQQGLALFNNQHIEMMQNEAQLKRLNEEKWDYLLKTVFNLDKRVEITLEQARQVVKAVAEAIESEPFLVRVEQLMKQMPGQATLIERRKELLSLLFPLIINVISRYGFEGEDGYLHYQRALMDFYQDQEIAQRSQRAQLILFKRANLL